MAQNNQADNSLDALWLSAIALLLAIAAKIWFGEQLSWVYVQMRWVWLKAITVVWEKENLMMLLRTIETRHVREMTADQLSAMSTALRFFMFPVWGALVGWVGYRAIKNNPGARFRRILDRSKLAKEMSEDFPWSLPALKVDLVQESIKEGRWAMALPPLAFARKYSLLTGKTLDVKRAEKLFASQLGKLWNGPDRLNPYSRALFACFAAQICRDKDAAVEALKELTVSISAGNPIYNKTEALLKKHGKDPRVIEICSKHAYQYTVLISMFDEAKKLGILPPSYFLWLRPSHRMLWYVLNCVRRRTPFAEVSGVYAHYLAEKIAGHRIEQPYVTKAVAALERAIREIDFTPTADEAKRGA